MFLKHFWNTSLPTEAAHQVLKQSSGLIRAKVLKTDVLSHVPIRWKLLLQRSSLSWKQDHSSLKAYLISLSIRNTRCKWKAVSISSRSVENMKRDGNDWQPNPLVQCQALRGSKSFHPCTAPQPLDWEEESSRRAEGLLYRCTQEMHTCVYMGGALQRGNQAEESRDRECFRAKTIRLCFYSLTKTSLKRRGDGALKESPSLYRGTDRK